MALLGVDPSALWYVTRATGAVSLLLLSASVVLGILTIGRVRGDQWPRFVVEGIHRNVSLLAIAFLAIHIATSVLDPFASIRLLDAFIPFSSSYRPLWLGLGAVASDLLIAIALTSIFRRRLGHTAWRGTHWLAYACWPIAVAHTVGTGSDVKQTWMLALTATCVTAVMCAVWARLRFGWPHQRCLRLGGLVASLALPAALIVWLPGGPLAADWARRAGTPLKDLRPVSDPTQGARSRSSTISPGASSTEVAFLARVSGKISRSTVSGVAEVDIALSVDNPTLGSLDVRIDGTPVAGGGVEMTASNVSIGTSSTPSLYTGSITALDASNITAEVSSIDRGSLILRLALEFAPNSPLASGTLQVTPIQ